MKVIEAGHVYEVQNVDGDGTQTIRFVRRRDDEATMLPTMARQEGVLTQELLRVCIDRTLYLNAEAPCPENVVIVDCLRTALREYEARAARRTIEKHPMPERMNVCEECQHALCSHRGFDKPTKEIDMAGRR
jgi:hypothetical protein